MTRTKKTIFLALSILIIAFSLNGCNTMEGAGRDIEEAGEGIQEAAD